MDAEWDDDVNDAIEQCQAEIIELGNKFVAGRARERYLDNMAQEDDEDEDDRTCILCRCDFVRGFVTPW